MARVLKEARGRPPQLGKHLKEGDSDKSASGVPQIFLNPPAVLEMSAQIPSATDGTHVLERAKEKGAVGRDPPLKANIPRFTHIPCRIRKQVVVEKATTPLSRLWPKVEAVQVCRWEGVATWAKCHPPVCFILPPHLVKSRHT